MDRASCDWIRGRLPLFVGAGDDLDDPNDEGGDLAVEDRRAIERHLAACPVCREQRTGLAGAMGALAALAGVPPVAPDAPSLWPDLERRIAGHGPRSDAGKSRKPGPAPVQGPIWATLDDERPLRTAWLQDTVREVAEATGLVACADGSGTAGHGRRDRLPFAPSASWRVVGASLAASVLVLMIVEPVAWRLRAGAEAKILANAIPMRALAGPPAPAGSRLADRDRDPAAEEEDGDGDARQLAQAEPIKPPAEPPAASETPMGTRPGAASRFGFDLEHGTPMPPDGRDAKPVY